MLLYEYFKMKTICFLLVMFFLNVSNANQIGSATGLELPRYVSLKSNDSNIRVGPSKNYPITIKYVIKDYPLKVIEEYRDWRKIEDFQNNIGWIHRSLIKGERNGIIISDKINNVSIFNTENGKVIGEISIGAIIHLNKCKKDWCFLIKNDHKGWVKKKYIWGVNKNEKFNIGFFQFLSDYYIRSINLITKYII